MTRRMQKRLMMIVAAFTGAFLLTVMPACHTVEGAGRDVQAIGEGVEHGAEETRPYDSPR